MLKSLLTFIIFLTSIAVVFAQYKTEKVWGAKFHYGSIFAHSDFVQNTKGANPHGFEIEFASQSTDSSLKSKYGSYLRTGWSLSYFDFNTPILGNTVNLGYYIQPQFIINNHWQWYYKAGIGLGYLSSPFDSVSHPENQTYSLHINAFLQFSAGINYHINNQYSITAAANFLHNSNGCINSPNRGVNYPGISIGIEYQPNGNNWKNYNPGRSSARHWYKNPLHSEVATFAGIKHIQNTFYGEKNTINYGVKAKVFKEYNSFNTFSVGAAVCYDNELKAMNTYNNYSYSNYLVAVMIGHEFVFPHWIFSQEIGYYIYKDVNDVEQRFAHVYPFLHHWQFSYKIDNHWLIGTGLKAHLQFADFVDLHMGYRW